MTIKEVIEALEKAPASKEIPFGFGKADSWRGSYEQCAFRPVKNTTAGEMLKHAREAIGAKVYGWKGGTYRLDEDTYCHIAWPGQYREDSTLTPGLLSWMLGKEVVPTLWEDDIE